MHPANNAAHSVTTGHSLAFRFSKITIILLALFMLICCRPSSVLLQPVPANVERIEGHASLRITGEGGSARSKFTFLFQLPHKGRIEVSDVLLGRILYQIIVDKERGNNGFDYDPIFQPSGSEKTFGEMTIEEKNEFSHRGKALQKFNRWLKEEYW